MGYEKKTKYGNRMWLVLSALLCAFMLAVLPAKTVHAEKQVTVTASSANIRSSADAGSTAVASVLKGAKLSVIEETTGTDGKTWYKVWVDANTTGYIRADLAGGSSTTTGNTTTTTTTTTPTVNTNVTVNTDGVQAVQPVSASVTKDQVRVRADSSTSSSIVTTVKKDVVLTVSGTKAGSSSDTWYLVSFMAEGTSTNVTGYIRSDYIKLNGELTEPEQPSTEPTTPDTPTEPDVEEPVVETKTYDTVYENNAWYLVNNDEGKSYPIDQLITGAEKNADALVKAQKKLSGQTGALVVLAILLVLLALGITLLIFRVKDLLEETGEDLVSFLLGRDSGNNRMMGASRPVTRRPESRGAERARPTGTRPAGTSASGARPAGTRPTGASASGAHPSGNRPTGERPAGTRPTGASASGAHPSGNRPTGERPAGTRPAGTSATGTRPMNTRPAGTPASGARPSGERPMGTRPAGTSASGARPSGERPMGTRPAGTSASGARPSGERPMGTRPAGTTATGARPAGERPVRPGERPASSEERVERQARSDVENRNLERNNADSKAWKSKNFMTDDDEFEFEFLNWDGEEEK